MWGGGKCRTLAGAEAGPGELSQELISPYPHLECAIHHLPSDRVLVRAPQECVFQGAPGAHCNFRGRVPTMPSHHPTQFRHTKALTMASVKGHAHT